MPPSAAAGIPFTLEIVSGPTDVRPHIVERLPFVVGRLSDADWMVPDPAISGHHFRFEHDGDALVVVDLRSRNKLFVNDREVERSPIVDGDVIKAGKTRFRVQFAIDSTPATSASPLLPVITAQPVPDHNWRVYRLGEDPLGEATTLDTAFEIPVPSAGEAAGMRFTAAPRFAFTNPQRIVYAVVDAAQKVEFAFAAKDHGCQPVSLFLGERAWELVEAAPYLSRVPIGSPFLSEWNAALGNHVGVLIDSAAPPQDVFVHLRVVFVVQDESGQEFFFRYYDPRVLNSYLPTCTPAELREFFGPIRAFIAENPACDGFVAYTIGEKGLLAAQELGTIEVGEPGEIGDPATVDLAPTNQRER